MEVDPRRTGSKSTKSLAVCRVGSLGTVGIHPELGGARVEVDGDCLRRCANLNVNGVEKTGLAVVETSLLLAAEVLVEGLLVASKRESDEASLLNKKVLIEKREGGSDQRQRRDGKKCRTHSDCVVCVNSTGTSLKSDR